MQNYGITLKRNGLDYQSLFRKGARENRLDVRDQLKWSLKTGSEECNCQLSLNICLVSYFEVTVNN